jgi:hypothetical protein
VNLKKHKDQIVITGKGFSAIFSRDAQLPIEPELPSFPLQLLIRGVLPLFYLVKYILKACGRLIVKITNKEGSFKARERFFNSLLLGDLEDTKKVMSRLISHDLTLVPQILVDFLSQPSVWIHMKKLMHGANSLILGNTEELFQKLTQLEGAKQRPSSHPHKVGTSYGLETHLFGELLFWKDEKGNLRMQFESHSLNNLFKIYYHFVDYLRYKLHGHQQGPYGASKRTDTHPLIISV